jgi:hypothetical protein
MASFLIHSENRFGRQRDPYFLGSESEHRLTFIETRSDQHSWGWRIEGLELTVASIMTTTVCM